MSSTVLQNIKQTTQATLDALNAWDYDALVAVRSEDFVFQGLPQSLDLPPMNNEEYQGMFKNMMTPAFQEFKIKPTTLMHDAETRKSTMYGSVGAQTVTGPRSWELIQIFSFNETGDKLVRLDEFFDSKVYLDMIADMQKHGGEGGQS